MFDLLGKYWKWREHPNVIPFDFEGQDEINEGIKDSLKDLGYETPNSFINLTTVMLVIFFYYFKIIIAGFMRILILLTNGQFGTLRFYNILTKHMFFKDMLGVPLEAYLEFLINAYINLKSPL